MRAPAQVSYEVYEGAEGLERLRPAWESLEPTGADHIFQTYAHADLWQRTVGAGLGARPLLIALREGERVVGIFPACRVRHGGAPILTWLGAPRILDYGDVLFDAEAADTLIDDFVSESLRILARNCRGALLYLTNVRADARAFDPLRSRLRVLKESRAPFVPAYDTWEEYLSARKGKLRRDINRRTRHLSEAGRTEFALLEPDDPGVATALARLVGFQRERFASPMNRTTLFDECYVRFRAEQAAEPYGRVVTLRLDGVHIAAAMGAVYRGRFYYLVHGFDLEFSALSPGFLVNGFLVRSCFENGWDPCDLCWGDEQWKYRWTDSEMRLTTFVSDDAKGAVLATAAGARHGLIALRRRLRK